ncbi:MAG TPA: hypothetical protein VMF31_05510 [Solirubrobacterales bacterium]|nr:hypothetical protein [Solirubrobacterales bacterium]
MAESPRRANRRKSRPGQNGNGPAPEEPTLDGAEAMKRGYAKAEIKNQKVRESLEPLEPGERPTVVTVGAVFALIVALILWGSAAVALFTGAEVNGEKVNIAQWASLAAIFSLMAWGMWKARYWAVLGFQMLLVLLILACVLGLVVAGTLLQMVSTTLLAIGLCLLFFFMVKAMARIQMPQGPNSR